MERLPRQTTIWYINCTSKYSSPTKRCQNEHQGVASRQGNSKRAIVKGYDGVHIVSIKYEVWAIWHLKIYCHMILAIYWKVKISNVQTCSMSIIVWHLGNTTTKYPIERSQHIWAWKKPSLSFKPNNLIKRWLHK